MLARLIGGVSSIFVLLFVHFWVGVGLVVFYLLLSVGYYFYLYRLALSVFLLAASVQPLAGKPVGRAPAADGGENLS